MWHPALWDKRLDHFLLDLEPHRWRGVVPGHWGRLPGRRGVRGCGAHGQRGDPGKGLCQLEPAVSVQTCSDQSNEKMQLWGRTRPHLGRPFGNCHQSPPCGCQQSHAPHAGSVWHPRTGMQHVRVS